MIKKNIKLLIGIIIGGIVFGSIGVYGAGKLYASSIDVDTSKMSELGETSNVNLALNYLYGKAASVTSSGIGRIIPTKDGDVSIIYLNPKNVKEKCTEENSVSTTGTKEGCMKWYIYAEDTTSYTAILDHNTTAKVAYNSTNSNTLQKEVAEALSSDTTGWDSRLGARLITADEIAKITGADEKLSWNSTTTEYSKWFYFDGRSSDSDTTWQTKTAFGKGDSDYAWLFDYTYNCKDHGCNIRDDSTYGYWTSTAVNESGSYVWFVQSIGYLFRDNASGTRYGVRPVIEIPKSIFN